MSQLTVQTATTTIARPLADASAGLEHHRDETTEEQAPTELGGRDNSCVGDELPDDAAKIYVSLSDDEELKEAVTVNPITDYDGG